MRALVNPSLAPERVAPPGGAEVLAFHRALPGYAPTALRPLPGEAEALGLGELWLKDENGRFGLPAFKITGASWALERLLDARPGVRSIWAASEGNHGRAVARAAAQRGLAARIFLPEATSEARAAAIAGEGAEVVRVAGRLRGRGRRCRRGRPRAGRRDARRRRLRRGGPGRALGLGRVLDDLPRGRRTGGCAVRRRALPDRRGRAGLGRGPLRLPPAASRVRDRRRARNRRLCDGLARGRPAGRDRDAGHDDGRAQLRDALPRRLADAARRPRRAASRSPMPRRTRRCAIWLRWASWPATAARRRSRRCAPSCTIRSAPSSRAALGWAPASCVLLVSTEGATDPAAYAETLERT